MGAPVGNQNAARARKWRDAIDRVLAHWPDKPETPLQSERGLHEAAYLFVAKMMHEQDLGFFKEFGDRLDGKPAQAIVGDDEHDPVRVLHRIERTIVRPDAKPSDR
jgi:hypothetical protein